MYVRSVTEMHPAHTPVLGKAQAVQRLTMALLARKASVACPARRVTPAVKFTSPVRPSCSGVLSVHSYDRVEDA